MPGHDVHLYVDYVYFGRTYPKIHIEMDKMVKSYGRSHRIFFHDFFWARHIAIREYPGDPDAIMSAQLHLWVDKWCSEDSEFRRLLEERAKVAKKQRAQMKQLKVMIEKASEPTRREKETKDFLDLFYPILENNSKLNLMIMQNLIVNQRQSAKLMSDVLKSLNKPKGKRRRRKKPKKWF